MRWGQSFEENDKIETFAAEIPANHNRDSRR